MTWQFEGSWAVLVSGTAVGLSLIVWSLCRARQQHRRRDVIEVLQERRVMVPEKPLQAKAEEPAPTVPEPAAEVEETAIAPAPQKTDEVEGLLFVIEAHMYELKAEAENLPAIQIRRRAQRGPVDEQLLLWPDADDPPVGRDQRASIATT